MSWFRFIYTLSYIVDYHNNDKTLNDPAMGINGHILILAFPYHTYDESMISESAIQYFTLYYAG